MSSFDDLLEHHGIKGMRWGVRRSDPSGGGRGADRGTARRTAKAERQLKRADKRWDRQVSGLGGYLKVYNAAADKMNATEIARINNKPEYKGVDMRKKGPVQDKYFKEYATTFTRVLNEQSRAIHGTNASGTKKVVFEADPNGNFPFAKVVDVKVKHDESTNADIKLTFDDLGRIVKVAIVPPVEHMINDIFLQHHGIKGMRWGFRKESGGVSTGRKRAPTSEDFKKAQAAKSKVVRGKGSKKTAQLSNDELQSLVKRMNLEKQYSELSARDRKKVVGAKFVGDVIGGVAKGQATRLGNQIAADQLDKLLKNARKK